MYFLYSIFLLLFLLIYLSLSLFQDPFLRKYRHDLGERFGIYPSHLKEKTEDFRPLWIHAVSVGEMMAASPFISELTKRRSGERFILSAVTATGRRVAKEKLSEGAADVLFFPLDFRWIVRRSLKALRPRAVILTETELWPHFLRACAEQGIPCILINGRISEGSFRRYQLAKGFFRRMIEHMPLLCMQSEMDRSRIVQLGADRSRTACTGNLKFDQYAKEEEDSPRFRLLQDLMIEDQLPVFIAGSTHRGEEKFAIEAFLRAKRKIKDLLFLLAPRHPERLLEVERLLNQRGLTFTRRSLIQSEKERRGDVILLDTMGELGRIYSLGTIIFVGGSLVPVGGHNILEPALYDKPILFGPHMKNFQEIAELFLFGGAALSVRDAFDLAEKLLWLLQHPQEAKVMGEKAQAILRQHRGAAQRTWELLKEYV